METNRVIIRYFLAVLVFILFLICLYLSLIFLLTGYSDVLKLNNVGYKNVAFDHFEISLERRPYELLVGIIWVSTLFLSLLFIHGITIENWVRKELGAILRQFYNIINKSCRFVRNQHITDKANFIFLIILILLVRYFYLERYYFTTDEVASFDCFVKEGPLAVVAYYPIPNNHILSNFISTAFSHLSSNEIFIMRFPTFLISAGGTLLMYFIIARYFGFEKASFCIIIFSFSGVGIFYSIAGRGYFLLTILAFINFFSMLRIMYKPNKHKLYWFIFIISSLLGFYTVPTFLYSFSSTFLISSFYFLIKRRKTEGLKLLVSIIIIGTATLLLYIPVIAISGLDALINNKFVRPMEWETLWATFPQYFNYTEGWLLGQERLGKYFIIFIVILSAIKIYQDKEENSFLKFALPSLFSFFFPYCLMFLHKTFAPERSLFYKSIYLYFVAVILSFWFLKSLKEKYKVLLVSIIVLAYSSYQIYYVEKSLSELNPKEIGRKITFQWLLKNNAKQLLVLDAPYALFLNHYFKTANMPCKIYLEDNGIVKYDFVVMSQNLNEEVINLSLVLGKEVYKNESIKIFEVISDQ
ncbi:glycosyltransferase family 39 protein [Adhaeribacter aquaticus]|uniref:glycosyltransferase family 39 protein n=1 Tax=Adhaeribacter aquaticus TaxID=299567 RepID=UPI00042056C3|nr:glycosyltransferase family 39 protein [Adhaeribacter aquaticus]